MSGNGRDTGNLGKHTERAKLIKEVLLAAAAVMTVGALLYLNWRIALFVSLGLSIIVSVYVLFFWNVPSRIVGGMPKRWIEAHPHLRRALIGWLVAVIFIIGGLGWAFTSNGHSPHHADVQGQVDPDPNVILVARLDGPDKDYGVTEIIVNRLREAVVEFPDVNVKVLDEVISPIQGSEYARQKGRDEGAGIVLWGWYRKTSEKTMIDVHFEMLRRPVRMPTGDETTSLVLAAADLEAFKIQQELSEKLNCLVLLTAGLVQYEAKEYDGAIARFTRAIERYAAAERLTKADAFFLFRGNAYAFKEDYTKAIADYDRMIGNFEPGERAEGLASALTARGMAYVRNRELKKGLADFDRVIPLKPHTAYAHNNRGAISFQVDRTNAQHALVDISRAIELAPGVSMAYRNRADLRRDW